MSYCPAIPASPVIGHNFWIQSGNEVCVAQCIDATPDDQPKRMRVRHGAHEGSVVMPGCYRIMRPADDLEPIFHRTHS